MWVGRSGGLGMVEAEWDRVFLDKHYLKIMYYLAKYNPSVASKQIATRCNMNEDEVEEKLFKLANLKIATFEKKKGYSLTGRGLMSLYNFHTNFNNKKIS